MYKPSVRSGVCGSRSCGRTFLGEQMQFALSLFPCRRQRTGPPTVASTLLLPLRGMTAAQMSSPLLSRSRQSEPCQSCCNCAATAAWHKSLIGCFPGLAGPASKRTEISVWPTYGCHLFNSANTNLSLQTLIYRSHRHEARPVACNKFILYSLDHSGKVKLTACSVWPLICSRSRSSLQVWWKGSSAPAPHKWAAGVGRLHDDKWPISVTPHNSLPTVASAPASPADETKIVPERDTSDGNKPKIMTLWRKALRCGFIRRSLHWNIITFYILSCLLDFILTKHNSRSRLQNRVENSIVQVRHP